MAKMKAFPLWPHSTRASFSLFLWHLWDQSLWMYSLLYPYLTLCLPQDNDIHLLNSWMNKGVNESQTRKAAWDITREGTESFITHIHFSLSSRSKYIVLSTPRKHTLNCRALASAWNAPSSSTQRLLPYPSRFRLTILSAGKDACQCKVSPSRCYSSSSGHLSCIILIKM